MELVQIQAERRWLLMCSLWGYSQLWTGSSSLWLSEFKWAAGTFTLAQKPQKDSSNTPCVYIRLMSGYLNWCLLYTNAYFQPNGIIPVASTWDPLLRKIHMLGGGGDLESGHNLGINLMSTTSCNLWLNCSGVTQSAIM